MPYAVRRGERLAMLGHGLVSVVAGLVEVLSLGHLSTDWRAWYLFDFLEDDE